ncbi:hypothetical protein PVAND_001286 [Polypedilum vanderplanki]|uniref:C2H2-type domain-containing protein n=1 Tax=Polypedilum vanderplanki TaxID=319348 RepID=A0A9J6BMX1_POLVA|nr:hypothetical protein PVAND_001286 [Polypedilum vanderplanki]
MKNQESCFCCLEIPNSKRDLLQFKENDKNLYKYITGNEISEEIEPKICKMCIEKLNSAYEFIKLCQTNYVQNNAIFLEDISTQNEILITVCEQQTDNFLSDDDDNIPISIIREQQQQLITQEESQIIEVLKIETINEEEVPIKNKKYKCSECLKYFSTNQKLQLHSFTHSGIKNFSCDFEGCQKKFATNLRLQSHKRVHSNEKDKLKRYTCDFCNVSFAQSNALKCHKRTHTNEKPFICPYDGCEKRFTQRTILKTHIAARHEKKFCLKCDVDGCEKLFPRKSFLILHKKRDHENIRDYTCKICDKSYKQQSHLTRHEQSTHLNIRHNCNICKKSFSKKWSLKMHLFKHTETNNFPYKCEECNEMFQRRDKWQKHYEKLHPNVEYKKDPIEIILPTS